jgi:hypothetical protein
MRGDSWGSDHEGATASWTVGARSGLGRSALQAAPLGRPFALPTSQATVEHRLQRTDTAREWAGKEAATQSPPQPAVAGS